MAYLFDTLSLLSLVINYEEVELASLIITWSKYSGLSAILAIALMSSVSIDQLSLIQGKFQDNLPGEFAVDEKLSTQPMKQFLKYHFSGSTRQDRIYLAGADKIGQMRFFTYNLGSSLLWISTIAVAGAGLRYLWINTFSHFGPFEVEIIAGILTVYVSGLLVLVLTKLSQNPA